jgi:hypothetical protein
LAEQDNKKQGAWRQSPTRACRHGLALHNRTGVWTEAQEQRKNHGVIGLHAQ